MQGFSFKGCRAIFLMNLIRISLHHRRFDAEERERKREARVAHKRSEFAQKVHGIRAKLYNQKRFKEKATMRKTIAQHNERSNKHANDEVRKNNMLQGGTHYRLDTRLTMTPSRLWLMVQCQPTC